MSDVTNMAIIHHISVSGVKMTDVECCGGYVFVSMENRINLEEGIVQVYKRYDEMNENLQLVANITVGPIPDMVLPTSDCLKLVVAIEAEPYRGHNRRIEDPLGAVTIIKFQDITAGNYTMKQLNFSHFNERIDALEKEGVRFVYRKADTNTFANDVEPEYIAFNNNETLAYICLQENNAIAVVDLVKEQIINVHGLGFKDWNQFEFDASDKDGGINMQPWPVYGMYQPDAIKFITIGDVEYLVTANEGDEKYYKFFKEETRVEDVTLSNAFGRLKITKENGKNSSSEGFDALYTFGGRSFSIWRADNMSLVYDSGSSISKHTATLYPSLFNMDNNKDDVAMIERDKVSDNKGSEPNSLSIAKFGHYTLIIVGNEEPGTLMLYSIDERKSIIEPEFKGMFHDISRLDAMWKTLVSGHDVSMIKLEDMRFIGD